MRTTPSSSNLGQSLGLAVILVLSSAIVIFLMSMASTSL